MRLTAQQKEVVLQTVNQALADESYQLYLFGSRTDDDARGGDVDLLLKYKSEDIEQRVALKHRIKMALEQRLQLPVDIVIQGDGEPLKAVTKIAEKDGILLSELKA